MKENEKTVSFLAKFDEELWRKFKDKLYPFKYSLKNVIGDFIKIFVGEIEEANPDVVDELRKQLEKEG